MDGKEGHALSTANGLPQLLTPPATLGGAMIYQMITQVTLLNHHIQHFSIKWISHNPPISSPLSPLVGRNGHGVVGGFRYLGNHFEVV